jgi:hypothetical protein
MVQNNAFWSDFAPSFLLIFYFILCYEFKKHYASLVKADH